MGRKKVEPLEKRIPFNKSVKRKIVLAFEKTCEDIGLNSSSVTEELLINFVNDYSKKPK